MSGVKRYTVQAAFTGSVAEPTEIVLASDYDTLRAANQRLREAFIKMRNVAAGYSNHCEESASTRRLDREFEAAEAALREQEGS
jgi:hypothetical protein